MDNSGVTATLKGDLNGSNPSPKAPVRSGGVYQIVLAEIRVNAGVTAITTANITDKRPDSSVCGWVTGTVQSIDLDQVLAQSTAQFNAWFATLQDILDEDTAGHLQNEITALQTATTYVNAVLEADSWVSTEYSFESDYPHASYDIRLSLRDSATPAEAKALAKAMLGGSTTSNVYTAIGTVPAIDIPIILEVTEKTGGNA